MIIFVCLLLLCIQRVSSVGDTSGYDKDDEEHIVHTRYPYSCATKGVELIVQSTLVHEVRLFQNDGLYTRQHFDTLLKKGALWHAFSNEGERIVLIKNNTWYYPYQTHTPSVHFKPTSPRYKMDGVQVSLWLTSMQYWFYVAIEKWNMTFPDVVFFLDISDAGYAPCARTTMDETCAAPSFSLWKRDLQHRSILMPYFVGINHNMYTFEPFSKKVASVFFRGRPNEHPMPHIPGYAGAREYLNSKTNKSMIDVQLISNSDSREQELSIRNHAHYKYLAALDGITGSFRFGRLMHTNSVLFKQVSPWIEYYYPALIEGTHYIPILQSEGDVEEAYHALERDQARAITLSRNSQRFAEVYLCPKARMMYAIEALKAYSALFVDMQKMVDAIFIEKIVETM